MLRVAIVGVSGYGAILTDLLSSFAAEGKVRFVAATVVNRAQQSARCDLLERQNVRVFDDYREMFSASGRQLIFASFRWESLGMLPW